MVEQTPVHTAKVGSVTATVYRVNGFTLDFRVKLSTNEDTGVSLSPEELAMVQEAAKQAEYFIGNEKQLAQRNPCPGCGDG